MTTFSSSFIAGAIRRSENRSGTSLVEAMVSVLILAVAVVGTASFLFHAHSSIRRAALHSVAGEACASRLEELTSVAYADLNSHAETDKPVSLGDISGERTTEIVNVDENGDEEINYVRITVTVTWTQANGAEQYADAVTLRSQ